MNIKKTANLLLNFTYRRLKKFLVQLFFSGNIVINFINILFPRGS